MFNFDSCGQSTQVSTIVCEENKRKFIGLNKNRKTILKVKVDGCLKKIEGKRCDWLLIDISANIAYFIELKGSDVKHAFQQLSNTIKIISNPQNEYIEEEFNKKYAYAILSKCPIDSTKIQNVKKKFREDFETELTVKNKQISQQL